MDGLHLGRDLLPIEARKEGLVFFGDLIAARVRPERIALFQRLQGRVEVRGDLSRRLGQEGRKQARARQDALGEVVEDGRKAVLLRLVLAERPGHRLVDVLVGAAEDEEELVEGVGDAEVLHARLHLFSRACDDGFELLIDGLRNARVAHNAVKILARHGEGAAHEIAKRVGKVGIDALGDELPGDGAVAFVGHLVEHEVTHGVHAEHGGKVVRIDDVAARFAHLFAALQEPGVGKDVVGKRLAERHQEDGPVDGMEAGDVFSDDVQLFGMTPEFVVEGRAAVGVVPEPRDVVGEGVQPHIDDVAAVEIDGDAPLKSRARDAQILQALH